MKLRCPTKGTLVKGAVATLFLTLATAGFEEARHQNLTSKVPLAQAKNVPNADVIIIFTGDGDRKNVGFSIAQPGQRVHVSGCPPYQPLNNLLNGMPFKRYPQVSLDDFSFDYAADTKENARETVRLIKENNFKNPVIVTMDYHAGRCWDLTKRELEKQNYSANVSFYVIPCDDMGPHLKELSKYVKRDLIRVASLDF